MQVAMIPGQSPSTLSGSATPDSMSTPVSDDDRLRLSMEAWKRNSMLLSDRYKEARNRQLVVERADRDELRRKWMEEESKKQAENAAKAKDTVLSGGSMMSHTHNLSMYQSATPNRGMDRKRRIDEYGQEEWRQGFRMMEGTGMVPMKQSADQWMNYQGMQQYTGGGIIMSQQQMTPSPMTPTPSYPSTCSAAPSTSMESSQSQYHSESAPPHFAPVSHSQFPSTDSTTFAVTVPSPSHMCSSSPNQQPTPPAFTNLEQNIRSPSEDLNCQNVNEDNMAKMLTSISVETFAGVGADVVDSLLDNNVPSTSTGPQQPSTPSSVVSPGFPAQVNGGPHSVQSVHSAHSSNGNCNPPITPNSSVPPQQNTPFSSSNALGPPLSTSTPVTAAFVQNTGQVSSSYNIPQQQSYPVYGQHDIVRNQINQQQMQPMQRHPQITMGINGMPMNVQQQYQTMLQKQHMKTVMEQHHRGMIYPATQQQQYFIQQQMNVQRMQSQAQVRYPGGMINPPLVNPQRMVAMGGSYLDGGSVAMGGAMVAHAPPFPGYNHAAATYSHPYVSQYPMN